MKNSGKLLQLVLSAVLIFILTGVSVVSGIFSSAEELFAGIHINPASLIRVAVMAAMINALAALLRFMLGLLPVTTGRTGTLKTILDSMIRYVAVILIICFGLSILGVNVSTIVASIGIVALIIGFGAESLIEDMITGLFMILENQYNVGDIVEVGGFRGTVSAIGIRTTSITDAGGNVKIVNNSNMKDILNRSDYSSRAAADIAIPYETDIEAFEQVLPDMMHRIYMAHTDVMKSEPAYLGVAELGDSGVTLKFVVEVSEKDIYKVQRILNRDLWVEFRKAGVEVPYPQMDVHGK